MNTNDFFDRINNDPTLTILMENRSKTIKFIPFKDNCSDAEIIARGAFEYAGLLDHSKTEIIQKSPTGENRRGIYIVTLKPECDTNYDSNANSSYTPSITISIAHSSVTNSNIIVLSNTSKEN